jgi:hypothetical protein
MPGGHGNLHLCDVHSWFFNINIQANVKQRLAAWRAKKNCIKPRIRGTARSLGAEARAAARRCGARDRETARCACSRKRRTGADSDE